LDSGEEWYRKKSNLHHNELSKLVRVWSDQNRQKAVIEYARGIKDDWHPASRDVWEDALVDWPQVADRLQEHARRIFTGISPFRTGERLLEENPSFEHRTFCFNAARENLQTIQKNWFAAVLLAIPAVDEHVTSTKSIMQAATNATHVSSNTTNPQTDDTLASLATAGEQLKTIFAGRTYVTYDILE